MDSILKNEVTTAIILDTRRQKLDKTFPVKLRITYRRKQKYYNAGISMTPEKWEKVMVQERPRSEYKKLRNELIEIEKKADKLINDMQFFTFYDFERRLLQPVEISDDAFSIYDEKIKSLLQEGRIGSADTYKYSMKSIQSYYPKKKLFFEDISPYFLSEFESYLISQGKSKNTVGIYLRALRAVYNTAISRGIIPAELYPFGKRKDNRYKIPSRPGIKKALRAEDLAKIWNYEVIEGSPEHKARDIFIFSFLVNGINMHDISRLKFGNLDGDRLSFIRKKTENTNEEGGSTITAILTPEAKDIIVKWGNKKISEETYIFPILHAGIDPLKEKALVKQFVKTVNKYLKRIAINCGIESKVSTYTARHSFATVLKRSNAPISYISESLGHTSQKTTQVYLDSFDDDFKRIWSTELSKSLK